MTVQPGDHAVTFATALGTCGLTWRAVHGGNGEVVTSIQLPAPSAAGLWATMLPARALGDELAKPSSIDSAITAVRSVLAGESVNLTGVAIDLDSVNSFDQAVYAVTRQIPAGSVLTYGQVAEKVGQAGAAQAVGRSLGANPWPVLVPCHRVVGKGGKLTGFAAPGGIDTKRRMLLVEGASVVQPSLFD